MVAKVRAAATLRRRGWSWAGTRKPWGGRWDGRTSAHTREGHQAACQASAGAGRAPTDSGRGLLYFPEFGEPADSSLVA